MRHTMIGGAALAVVLACGQPTGPGELVAGELTAARPAAAVRVGAGPAVRHYGVEEEPRSANTPGPEDLADLLDYDLPKGWEVVESSQFRLINLRPAGDPAVECYISVLPSDGGGLVDNVNRWRDQMGLEPLSAEALAALPSRPFLAGDGVLVDFEGTFTGMDGSVREGWRLIGLVVPIPGQTLFVKMTGPAAVLEQEAAGFEAFCASVRPSARAAELHAQQPEVTQPPGGGLTWSPPGGWVDQGARPMRLVSYQVGAGTECYLALARGDQLTNYNRWRGQVSQTPMSAADLAALDTIEVLGQPCPLLEVTGEFRGMSGGAQPNTTLLGTMRAMAGDSLFVKMVGPAEEVEAARAEFHAFCASIGRE